MWSVPSIFTNEYSPYLNVINGTLQMIVVPVWVHWDKVNELERETEVIAPRIGESTVILIEENNDVEHLELLLSFIDQDNTFLSVVY